MNDICRIRLVFVKTKIIHVEIFLFFFIVRWDQIVIFSPHSFLNICWNATQFPSSARDQSKLWNRIEFQPDYKAVFEGNLRFFSRALTKNDLFLLTGRASLCSSQIVGACSTRLVRFAAQTRSTCSSLHRNLHYSIMTYHSPVARPLPSRRDGPADTFPARR